MVVAAAAVYSGTRAVLTRVVVVAGAVVALVVLLLPANVGAVPGPPDTTLGGDGLWWDGFYPPGTTGPPEDPYSDTIGSMVEFNGVLLVAGSFGYMDGIEAPGLVSWNGHAWTASPVGAPYSNLEVVNDSNGSTLICYGSGYADPASESLIYRWTGSEWMALAPEVFTRPGIVQDVLAVGDSLFVCGYWYDGFFERRSFVLLQDGSGWRDLFPTLPNSLLNKLAWSQGRLYVAGEFSLAPGDTSGNIAVWDGETWLGVDGGTDGRLNDVLDYYGNLVVAGWFRHAGGVPARSVAAWNGAEWSALGEGVRHSNLLGDAYFGVSMLAEAHGRLIAAGSFTLAGTVSANGIAEWDGSEWSALGFGPQQPSLPRNFALFQDRLVMSVTDHLGDLRAEHVLVWDGQQWDFLNDPGVRLVGPPGAFLVTEEGLVAGGQFTVGGQWGTTQGIARWDGSAWTMLASDLDGRVLALATVGNLLYAGGDFTRMGEQALSCIARWDGKDWSDLAGGTDGYVRAIAAFGGRLIAGGRFQSAGGTPASGIAAWDGESWAALGRGLIGGTPMATAMVSVGPGLIVSGYFSFAGYRGVNSIAIWDGRDWLSIDADLTLSSTRAWVNDIAVLNGKLYAAGPDFKMAGGDRAGDLIEWDAMNWRSLGLSEMSSVDKLGVFEGRLVAGGTLRWAAVPESTRVVALWDGTRWLGMGGDLRRWASSGADISAIAEWRGSLYLGGTFDYAGPHPSVFIARWDGRAYRARDPGPSLSVSPTPAVGPVAIDWFATVPGVVVLRVVDVQGRHVAILYADAQVGGTHTTTWDLTDQKGRRIPAGVYFLRLDTEAGHASRKIVVLPR